MIISPRQVKRLWFSTFVAGAVLVAPAARCEDELPPPRLVVVVVIDGLIPEQLARCEDLFVGGFRRMLDEGAYLTSCFHEHARTRSGPGHFVLLSGRHPGPAGIVDNAWYDASTGTSVYCVADSGARIAGSDRPAGSYRNVSASALGDWLKNEWDTAKVFSIARKAHSAIMMGGRGADGVYWYDRRTGWFVTSTYYGDTLHAWVQAFNALRRPLDYRHKEWERLLVDPKIYEERARADDYPGEIDFSSLGVAPPAGRPTFDHVFAQRTDIADELLCRLIQSFPWMDEITMELAREAVLAEELGQDEVSDLLAIGLSALDSSNHLTGPHSQESLDIVLRGDRLLGELLGFLDERVGDDHYVVLLTSDHGTAPLPEYAQELGLPARRAEQDVKLFMARLQAEGRRLCGGRNPFSSVGVTWLYVDRGVLEAAGVSEAQVDSLIRAEAAEEDWVARVYSRSELLEAGERSDAIHRRFQNNVHPSRSPDFMICEKPWISVDAGENGVEHGSPYDYDAHVPAIIAGTGIVTGRFGLTVSTADLAPTLAQILRLESIPEVDGSPIQVFLHPSLRTR